MRLFIDQYGNKFWVETVKELRSQIPGRCTRMYHEINGHTYCVGYVIGQHWLTEYAPVRKEVII